MTSMPGIGDVRAVDTLAAMAKSAGDRDRDRSGSTDPREPDPADGRRSWKDAWPFLVAFAVVLIAAAGIGISYLIRPADARLSTEAQVQHAINDSYTARNDLDYAKYRGATCSAELTSDTFPDETTFLDQNRKSFEVNGHIVIPEITDIAVNGDRATAKVHWHFDEKADQKQVADTVVVREDGDWKVCTS
jgi:hypothetical protein